jgi:regulator of protease activity HflC (stomatin/prohibitin superfamily)
METNNLFIMATRQKLRFPFKGTATVEDLWDMNVTDLDSVYKALNSQVKQANEESLLSIKSKEDSILEAKVEIVKFIVATKLSEAELARTRAEQRERKNRIAEILADKQDEELRGKSAAELQQMLAEMGE